MSALSLFAVTDYSDSSFSSGDAATSVLAFGMMFVIFIVIYLITSFLLYKVFRKAGRQGWIAFVPFYNYWTLFEISGKPGWWALLIIPSFIPVIGLLFSVALLVLSLLASLELAKRFGKDQVFAIFGLWLFSIIGYAILAFDDSKYHGANAAAASSANGPNKKPEVFANNNPKDSDSSQNPPSPPSLVQ